MMSGCGMSQEKDRGRDSSRASSARRRRIDPTSNVPADSVQRVLWGPCGRMHWRSIGSQDKVIH
eukprot:689417-Rhodomonas_salina.2